MGESFIPQDANSAKMGKVFVIIEGVRYRWMNVKNILVKAAPSTGELKSIGTYLIHHRQVSVTLDGSMTVYWVDSSIQDMVLELVKNNKQVFFAVQGVSEDPSSNSGKNSFLFTDCVLDGDIPLFQSDADGEFLEEEVSFKVNDTRKLNGFSNNTSIIAG